MKLFALKILAGIFLIFGAVYMTMVFTRRLDFTLYIFWCIILGLTGVGLFVYADRIRAKQVTSDFLGIISGLLLWSFIGEFLAGIEWIAIADWQFFPLLLIGIFFFVFLFIRGYLPTYALFALGHFLVIWLIHSVMVFEIHTLGKSQYPATHPATFITAIIFLVITVFSVWQMLATRLKTTCMVFALSALLFGWSLLEFIWAWRLIPGPWSMK